MESHRTKPHVSSDRLGTHNSFSSELEICKPLWSTEPLLERRKRGLDKLSHEMPRSSPRKRTVVNYNEDGEPKKRQSSPNVTESKVTQVKPQSSGTVKSSTKRKADVALPPPEATEPVTEAPKATKKQKTKSKDENAMPLASRTAVASLKKAKYIGAHVSGAGGNASLINIIARSESSNMRYD